MPLPCGPPSMQDGGPFFPNEALAKPLWTTRGARPLVKNHPFAGGAGAVPTASMICFRRGKVYDGLDGGADAGL